MSYCLYEFLPTEIVWKIYEDLHRSYMKDLNAEYNKYNNYIKRNCEDGFPIIKYIKNNISLDDEFYTDERLMDFYPNTFGDFVRDDVRNEFFNQLYNGFDNFYFSGMRDYDMELYYDYNDYRTGEWAPECSWW